MTKIMVVAGTRPEAIKLAPVINQLKARLASVSVCVTGQHREMLDQVFSYFGIAPDIDLHVMTDDQSLESLTATIMTKMATVYSRERPDTVVVQGDTTSVMVAATAAFYAKVKVAHVEAGLRSHDLYSPFPEEFNRRVVSIVARYHFAPTSVARAELIREGFDPQRIWVTGNTIIDALLTTVAKPPPPQCLELLEELGVTYPSSQTQRFHGRRLILVTGHRRENFGAGLEEICRGVRKIVDRYPDVVVVYPVHMNPNVDGPVRSVLGEVERVALTPPLDYPTLVHLMQASTLVLTDSGGIQEEAPSLGKPVLVMRSETERPEGVESGAARLVGASAERIAAAAGELLEDEEAYLAMARVVNPYGDGRASQRIAEILTCNDA